MLRSFRPVVSLLHLVLFTLLLAPLAMLAGCSNPSDSAKPDEGKAATANGSKTGDRASPQSPANKLETGRAVLEAMAKAYRQAKSYHDNGTVRLVIQTRGQKPLDRAEAFAVAFERPNKLALDVYSAKVRCDGKKFFAYLQNLPGQILEQDAPAKMEIKTLVLDPLLIQTLSMGPARAAPQPILLLEENGLNILLKGSEEPVLAESGEIDGRPCYRVQVRDPYGLTVYWVDRDSLVLRRIVLPSDVLRSEVEQQSEDRVESISIVADFTGAELDRPIDPKAFAFAMPDTPYQAVSYFIPPHPGQWVGKKSPEFKFTDLAGKSIAPQSLLGKAAVLIFWSERFPNFEQDLLDYQKLFDAYRNVEKVAVCVVCKDENADPKGLEEYCRSKKIDMPIYRNREQTESELEKNDLPNLMYLIGPDGIVQDYEYDSKVKLSEVLPPLLDRVLAGQDISTGAIQRYRKDMEQYEKTVKARASGEGQVMPPAKIADRSEPKTFKLAPLWKCAEVKDPGNILVLNEPKRAPRLLVASPPNRVAEVGLDGKVAAVHELNLAGGELAMNLRAFSTPAGKTYVAAFTGGQQRLHLFNLADKQTIDYPSDALQNPHSGIADVELFDLDGDGAPEIYVGYWGVVGVHAIALDGKRMWGNRSLSNVTRMAAGPADEFGRRDLICTNILTGENTSLVVLNAQGQSQGVFNVGKRSLRTILGADLAGDGNLQWCALGVSSENELLALGFNLQGRELWSFGLPSEPQPRPIEPIVAGRVTRQGPGQWILPGPDGSIQILAADGKPLDSFNYGAVLQGVATAEIGGKPALVIASPGGLEAFAVE